MFFARDSADLTPSDRAALDAYAQAYTQAATSIQVTVDAYASIDGQKQHNQALSVARAQSIASYLASKGVPQLNIKTAGHGETDAFSKDDPRPNRRATIAPKISAPAKPSPAPTPPPSASPTASPKASPAASPKASPVGPAPVITTQTEASQPSNRARTKLGVGERVTLTVTPGPGTWTTTKGKLSANSGAKITFTAADRAGKATVTVTVGGQSATVDFDVIEPSSVHMDVNGTRHLANGRPNAGMHTDVFVGPSDVSFANILITELEVASSTSGHWATWGTPGHHPNTTPGPMTTSVVSGKGTRWSFMDNCLSGDTGLGAPLAGTMSWPIPWQFQVGSGGKKTFLTVTQSVVTDNAGTTTISKAGASVSFKLTDGATSYPGSPY